MRKVTSYKLGSHLQCEIAGSAHNPSDWMVLDVWVSAGSELFLGGVLLRETDGRAHRGSTLDIFQNWYATRWILAWSQVEKGGIGTEKGKYENYEGGTVSCAKRKNKLQSRDFWGEDKKKGMDVAKRWNDGRDILVDASLKAKLLWQPSREGALLKIGCQTGLMWCSYSLTGQIKDEETEPMERRQKGWHL